MSDRVAQVPARSRNCLHRQGGKAGKACNPCHAPHMSTGQEKNAAAIPSARRQTSNKRSTHKITHTHTHIYIYIHENLIWTYCKGNQHPTTRAPRSYISRTSPFRTFAHATCTNGNGCTACSPIRSEFSVKKAPAVVTHVEKNSIIIITIIIKHERQGGKTTATTTTRTRYKQQLQPVMPRPPSRTTPQTL